MFTSNLTIVRQSGMDLTVQTLETTETNLLIRLRSEARIPARHRAAITLAAAHDRFTLTDGNGMTLMTAHMNSLSDGPFGGILYLAFPSDDQFDLGTPLTLKSENAEVIFQL
ncbi:hypothetical protein QF031_002298 [Pseudarthrobacter defluvii]|uniref:hypothetical protein n=1 Tax=Pseudarthrobacter defluvii TaxID=410837 RepID=UPI00277E4AF3|nr:hypothetical protein [Pseudarthrobacter defluvii]MDQ0769549.1 hypothetical protein [Pseudarthrobacter defluvii]